MHDTDTVTVYFGERNGSESERELFKKKGSSYHHAQKVNNCFFIVLGPIFHNRA